MLLQDNSCLNIFVQNLLADHEEDLVQLRLEYEEKMRGLIPSDAKEQLEATVNSLKNQVNTLKQRIAILQDNQLYASVLCSVIYGYNNCTIRSLSIFAIAPQRSLPNHFSISVFSRRISTSLIAMTVFCRFSSISLVSYNHSVCYSFLDEFNYIIIYRVILLIMIP